MNPDLFNEYVSDCQGGAIGSHMQIGIVSFENKNKKRFTIPENEILAFLPLWLSRFDKVVAFLVKRGASPDNPLTYEEKRYRALFDALFKDESISSIATLIENQTYGTMCSIARYVGAASGVRPENGNELELLDRAIVERVIESGGSQAVCEAEMVAAFQKICDFCKKYNEQEYLKSNDPEVRAVVGEMALLHKWLHQKFPTLQGQSLKPVMTKGVGKFPRVPWVALLPGGQEIGDGVYLAMCFGREGGGAVVGCCESVKNRKGLPVTRRSEKERLDIDVDGETEPTKYNDAFVDPREIQRDTVSEVTVWAAVQSGLENCAKYLNIVPSVFTPKMAAEFLERLRNIKFMGA